MVMVNPIVEGINLKGLLDLNYGFVRSTILDFALKFNIFEILQSTHKNQLDIISQKTCASKENIEKLLEALVYIGVIFKENDVYLNTLNTSKYLCLSSEHYIGEHLNLVFKQWSSWGNFEAVMLKDERVDNSSLLLNMKKKRYSLSFPIVEKLLAAIPYDFNEAKILDYHSGEGEWTFALVKNYNKAIIDAYDYANYKKKFEARMKKNYAGYKRNVKFISTIEDSYNYIILADFLRFYSKDYLKILLASLKGLLKNEGRIIIYDVFHSDSPSISSLIDLSMLVNTCGGNVLRKNDAISILQETGFYIEDIFNTKPYPIIIARSEEC
ncbi:class I SAM-dependent methyltransferase [Peribacillus frigoritolerans]|uniref:class I SAM-dependent methyltransferase n=1 Tax=Peribacillus TaxID=2675229 RepID=UPI002E1D348C|nr:class I SAM-dependent methyltransferase [Peribacillus frigoritolerans]